MENAVADIPGVLLILLGLTGQQQPMGHCVGEDKLHIGGNHIIPALYPCHGTAHGGQCHRGPGRCALTEIRVASGGGNEPDDIFEDIIRGIGGGHLVLNGGNDPLIGHSGNGIQRVAALLPAQKLQLIFRCRITHGQAHHKAIHLRIRQQLRAGGAIGVLGRNDHKGPGQGMGNAIDGYLTFLHGLQQCSLSPGGCPVELVCQKEVAEDRTLLIFCGALFLIIYGETGDISGHHVRGKLHAPIVELQGPGKSNGQRGLSYAGLVLQQQMSACQHGEKCF